MIRIVFVGCVEFSHALLAKVLTLPEAEVVGVVTRESSSFNTDFRSLKPLADKAGIPCFIDAGNRQDEMASWMKRPSPDVVYCFGWPYLLRKQILEISSLGVRLDITRPRCRRIVAVIQSSGLSLWG